MIRLFCERLSRYLPHITIPTPDGKPYLTRYYLLGADRAFGNIFLHHFHSSDMDKAPSGAYYLHNHPWPWSFSIILAGGYNEIRRQPDDNLRIKEFPPGSVNYINNQTFHRVRLDGDTAWTLFFTGPRSTKRSWGFWDPITKIYLDFKNFAKAVE